MISLQDNAASDFANSTSVDQIGCVSPADPMNCAMVEMVIVEACEGEISEHAVMVAAVGGEEPQPGPFTVGRSNG